MNKHRVGAYGELLSSIILEEDGHEILCRNYKNKAGEIDLITRKGDILHFIEVKLRRSSEGFTARAAVNVKKQNRIRRSAELYLKELEEEMAVDESRENKDGVDFGMSFDVIEINLELYANAF